MVIKHLDFASLAGCLQHFQGGQQCVSLSGDITRRTQRATHRKRGQQQPGQSHCFQPGPEHGAGHDHGGHTGFFEQTGDVSHGHVTNRSDWHQQYGIYSLFQEQGRPLRSAVA